MPEMPDFCPKCKSDNYKPDVNYAGDESECTYKVDMLCEDCNHRQLFEYTDEA